MRHAGRSKPPERRSRTAGNCLSVPPGRRARRLAERVHPRGEGCGWARSIVRNLPLLIPVWNLVEVVMVFAGKARTGDRIAHTTVTEE